MKEFKRTILIPQYFKEFSCIGSACEDTCCAGWKITIDKPTFKRYKSIKNKEMTIAFEKNLSRNRKDASEASYAAMKLSEEGACTFLDKDKLCLIQKNIGADYLCNTCSVYPRVINKVNELAEKSTVMSCPEAARLTLFNSNIMEFEEIEEVVHRNEYLNKSLNTVSETGQISIKNFFWELRIFTITVLQNRSYTISERLVILGLFFQKLQHLEEENKWEDVLELIKKYEETIEERHLKQIISSIPENNQIQLMFCKELLDMRINMSGLNSERYIDCLRETIEGLGYEKGESFESVADNYLTSYEKYYQPFFKTKEYIIENYLVNYVFHKLFPSGDKLVFDEYVMMIVHYSMIKIHLIGMGAYHQKIDEEMILKLIQSFSKSVEHNTVFLQNIFNKLEGENYNTMAYMTILILN